MSEMVDMEFSLEDVTGQLGEWLDCKLDGVPKDAIAHLQKAYEICCKEYSTEDKING